MSQLSRGLLDVASSCLVRFLLVSLRKEPVHELMKPGATKSFRCTLKQYRTPLIRQKSGTRVWITPIRKEEEGDVPARAPMTVWSGLVDRVPDFLNQELFNNLNSDVCTETTFGITGYDLARVVVRDSLGLHSVNK